MAKLYLVGLLCVALCPVLAWFGYTVLRTQELSPAYVLTAFGAGQLSIVCLVRGVRGIVSFAEGAAV